MAEQARGPRPPRRETPPREDEGPDADVGVEATTQIVQSLTRRVARKELADSGALYRALQEELQLLLKPVNRLSFSSMSMMPRCMIL